MVKNLCGQGLKHPPCDCLKIFSGLDYLKIHIWIRKLQSKTVGNPAFMKAGYEAQLKSMVLLKNKKQCIATGRKENGLCSQEIYARRKKFSWNGNA